MNLRWAKCCDVCKYGRSDGFLFHVKCVKLGYDVNISRVCDYYEEVDG